ncbi:MAG: ACT domain-containing protein [Demequina sp.]|uniref:ACT domain-containing protein n=1 Tax=Demequina sp. TaxID=2050685 RepID=UPI001996086D|nr:ACT domain-containing protein [Demequina sp.]MBC7297567.1 ACT domain-containing protein [Demequina sp.]
MSGETDLATLIASMRPHRDPVTYVWASVETIPSGIVPLATMREAEGLTVVCSRDDADAAGLGHTFPCARITLTVHSSLEAVGLTAAFAAALSEAGISANVVAGYHHDHIFVPVERAADAMAALEQLAASAM